MQIVRLTAEDCLERLLFCRESRGIYKVHYFPPFQNWLNVREERQRAIQGVREVVETASDKMSAAPELSPGDWKWIECISPYIDSHWHRRDRDRERERGELEWVNEWDEDKEKEHRGRERERKKEQWCVTSWPLEPFKPPSSPIIPLLRLRVLFSPSHSGTGPSHAVCPAECPTTSLHHQHQEMDTIGRARIIPGWQEQEGTGILGVKMP